MIIPEIEPLVTKEVPSSCGCWTFDVFDTVASRVVEKPVHVFHLMADELPELVNVSDFPKRRVDAERDARLNKEGEHEVTLKEIYKHLSKSFGWTDEQAAAVLQAECVMEVESAVPLLAGMRLLDHARAAGVFRGFVSDMYLPASTVEKILRRVGAWNEGDRLWVSSEYDETKHAQGLYRVVKLELGVEFDDWLHVGDNKKSDVDIPRSMGMQSIAMPPVVGAGAVVSSYLAQTYNSLESRLGAAANRAIRSRHLQQMSNRQKVIWDTSCNVTAPMLVCFVTWVLEEAERAGVKQLLFLARDGQILYRIARELCEAREGAPELKYVAASRHAWHAAGVGKLCEEDFVWIYANPESLTLDKVFARLAPAYAHAEVFESCPVPNGKGVLDLGQKVLLQDWLLSAELQSKLKIISDEARRTITRYLEQQGVGSSFGLVDIGWYGNMQSSFERIVQGSEFMQERLHGWYLGLFAKRTTLQNSKLAGFLFDVDNGVTVPEYSANVALFEMLLSADHPGVVGFTQEETVLPVLRDESSWLAQMEWGVLIQQHAILAFVEEWKNALLRKTISGQMECVTPLLKGLCSQPSLQQAKAFGDWPSETEQAGEAKSVTKLAAELDWRKVVRCFKGWAAPSNYELWRAGIKKRNSMFLYTGFRLAKAAGRRLQKQVH